MPRAPQQARSQARREAILDATAALLAREGLARVNTNAIATEAGCSVGSVYAYFENKEAVFRALVARYGERLLATVAAALAEPVGDWRELVDRAVDAFVAFYRGEPGYLELWIGAQLSDDVVAAGEAWGQDFQRTLGAVLVGLGVAEADAERVAVVAIYQVSALVTLALTRGDEALIGEAKRAVRAYLAGYIG